MDNVFFSFIRPFLALIDRGQLFRKPFSWLYLLIAGLNLLLPLILFIKLIDVGFLDADAKSIISIFLFWLVIVFLSWVSFQLWFDRSKKVLKVSLDEDDLVATPVFSHFIQTFGEWLGVWVGVGGGLFALLLTLLLGGEAYMSISGRGIFPGLSSFDGPIFILLMPIYGFLIIVFSRFLAEQFRAIASIANNTRRS